MGRCALLALMYLRLQFPPTPERMVDHAAIVVRTALDVDGVELDYGVASLSTVDNILGRFHEEGVGPEQVAETIFSFGAYIGEVIVRAARGSWVTVPETTPLGSQWPLVELPAGSLLNPVGKAFKRAEHGGTESIPYFYSVLVEQAE